MSSTRDPRTERGLDRLVNFSDAVVAIAITLLVLPLTDLVGDGVGPGTAYPGAWDLVSANADHFLGFAVTFAVTMIFWLSHHALFEVIGSYDTRLIWLNSGWLLFVVLLPFASGLLSEGGFQDGVGLIYGACLALLSAMQGLIAVYVRRHPQLLVAAASPSELRPSRAWAYTAFFVAIALLSLPLPSVAGYAMLLLIPMGRLLHR